jgi:hypothetical protein
LFVNLLSCIRLLLASRGAFAVERTIVYSLDGVMEPLHRRERMC